MITTKQLYAILQECTWNYIDIPNGQHADAPTHAEVDGEIDLVKMCELLEQAKNSEPKNSA